MFQHDIVYARFLNDACIDAEQHQRELFPEAISDEVFLDEGPYRRLCPLPIYEGLDLVAPMEYSAILPSSLVRVRLSAIHHYDDRRNVESFYLDVEELTVLRRNISNMYISSPLHLQ